MAKTSGSGSIFSGNAWMLVAVVGVAVAMFALLFAMIDEPAQQQAEMPAATEQAAPPTQQ